MVILIVEDEVLINSITSDDLQSEGYEVVSAYDADEAIEILEHRDDIDLVFTDIDMPGSMDGLMLAAAVRDRWPPIHIIITSGKAHPKSNEMPRDSQYIPKPWLVREVLEVIRGFDD